MSAAVRLDALGVRAHVVLRGVLSLVDEGMNAAAVPLVAGVPMVTRGRVMLVRAFVPVMPMARMVLRVLVLHRRMTSACVVMHGAALCVPFCVAGLRQFLVLGHRTFVCGCFRHGNDLARG